MPNQFASITRSNNYRSDCYAFDQIACYWFFSEIAERILMKFLFHFIQFFMKSLWYVIDGKDITSQKYHGHIIKIHQIYK